MLFSREKNKEEAESKKRKLSDEKLEKGSKKHKPASDDPLTEKERNAFKISDAALKKDEEKLQQEEKELERLTKQLQQKKDNIREQRKALNDKIIYHFNPKSKVPAAFSEKEKEIVGSFLELLEKIHTKFAVKASGAFNRIDDNHITLSFSRSSQEATTNMTDFFKKVVNRDFENVTDKLLGYIHWKEMPLSLKDCRDALKGLNLKSDASVDDIKREGSVCYAKC